MEEFGKIRKMSHVETENMKKSDIVKRL